MKLRDAAGLSADNLRKNPVRTLLTILGLGVGIGAVLTVLTLGSAGEEQVENEIARLGVDKVWITPRDESGALDAQSGEKAAAATGSSACAGAYTLSVVSLGDHAVPAQVAGFDGGMEAVHDPVLPLNVESDVPGGVKEMLTALYNVLKDCQGIDFTALEKAMA